MKFKAKPKPLVMLLIVAMVVIQVLFLRPAHIETIEDDPQGMHSSIENQLETLRQKDEIKYTMEDVHYTSIEGGKRQWEINSANAIVYDKANVLVADDMKMKMFENETKHTLIEGDKALFKVGSKEFDLEGHLKVTFPDDFWIRTEKAHYSGNTQQISNHDPFYGEAKPQKGELMKMWGTGFEGNKTSPFIYILKDSRVQMKRNGTTELTDVRSDRAYIDRFKKHSIFAMDDPDKFVDSNQGTLFIRARKQEATYESSQSTLKYLTAIEDVQIRETDPKQGGAMKYATSQRADFETKENKIILSGFPSVYQEKDTVTGELITVYRSTNIVEVKEANSFHEGSN